MLRWCKKALPIPASPRFPADVRLLSVASAVPSHLLPQDMVLARAKRILGPRFPEFERLSSSFLSAGIEQRYSVAPFDWFEQAQSWEGRNGCYLDGARALFMDAAQHALEKAGLDARDVDCVVTVSSTGIATPTLEARAMKALAFRNDVKRVPVFGLGCAGGVTGLSLATRLARADPGSVVLLVAVETCTLSFRSERLRKADIIATALFGDGAAAACVSTSGGQGPHMGEGIEYTWPDTLDIMGWCVEADGLGVIFDRSIPNFIHEVFRDALDAAAERLGFSKRAPDRFICHPGGAKVLDALEAVLNLKKGSLAVERSILRDYGNMSAPTVLFVLERVMQDSALSGRGLMAALGPGFTASMLALDFG